MTYIFREGPDLIAVKVWIYIGPDDPSYYITAHDCDALAHQGYRLGDAGCGGLVSEPILWP